MKSIPLRGNGFQSFSSWPTLALLMPQAWAISVQLAPAAAAIRTRSRIREFTRDVICSSVRRSRCSFAMSVCKLMPYRIVALSGS